LTRPLESCARGGEEANFGGVEGWAKKKRTFLIGQNPGRGRGVEKIRGRRPTLKPIGPPTANTTGTPEICGE